jgi:methyltransferase (TIGR00027 family)
MAVRSRYAEDQLAKAVSEGVQQYLVLGAGLDTFAFRNPHSGLRVFEVDHPATQQWKREQLQAADIEIPSDAVFVPVDFERQNLRSELERAACVWISRHSFRG